MRFHDEILGLKGFDVTIARIISRLLPAPLINFYVGVIIGLTAPAGLGPTMTPLSAILVCTSVMVILPITPILIEARRGRVDLDVSDRSKRARFLLFALVCYACAYLIYWLNQCDVMRLLSAAYFTVTTGVLIMTLRYKVSVHAAGVAGPTTALLCVYVSSAWPVLFLWPLVTWARVRLSQHTLIQGLVGLLLGFLITLLTYYFLLPL